MIVIQQESDIKVTCQLHSWYQLSKIAYSIGSSFPTGTPFCMSPPSGSIYNKQNNIVQYKIVVVNNNKMK